MLICLFCFLFCYDNPLCSLTLSLLYLSLSRIPFHIIESLTAPDCDHCKPQSHRFPFSLKSELLTSVDPVCFCCYSCPCSVRFHSWFYSSFCFLLFRHIETYVQWTINLNLYECLLNIKDLCTICWGKPAQKRRRDWSWAQSEAQHNCSIGRKGLIK